MPNCCGMTLGKRQTSAKAQVHTTSRGKMMTMVSSTEKAMPVTSGRGLAARVAVISATRPVLGDGADIEQPEEQAEGERHYRLGDGVERIVEVLEGALHERPQHFGRRRPQ